MASHVIPINSPGLAAMDPRQFDHQHITQPKYPIDEMADADDPDWD